MRRGGERRLRRSLGVSRSPSLHLSSLTSPPHLSPSSLALTSHLSRRLALHSPLSLSHSRLLATLIAAPRLSAYEIGFGRGRANDAVRRQQRRAHIWSITPSRASRYFDLSFPRAPQRLTTLHVDTCCNSASASASASASTAAALTRPLVGFSGGDGQGGVPHARAHARLDHAGSGQHLGDDEVSVVPPLSSLSGTSRQLSWGTSRPLRGA